jgi:hypothetical protein
MTTRDSEVPEAVVPVSGGHVVEVAGGALGALGGAATGAAMGGPIGAAVGAVIGAAMGAASGWGADKASQDQDAIDAQLDKEIGVTEGTVGSPNLRHPASQINAPSAAAAGAGGAATESEASSSGPIQNPPD